MFFSKNKKEEAKEQMKPAKAPENKIGKGPDFEDQFGELTIRTVKVESKNTCLEAVFRNQAILMDTIDTDEAPIPEGLNAYMIGNKLVMVNRWNNMSKQEKLRLKCGDLVLVIHPYEFMQFSLKIGGNWGDVMFTLPHCITELNDEDKPVDEFIFIFCDSKDPNFIDYRVIELPGFVQNLLMKGNKACHKALSLDNCEQKNGLIALTPEEKKSAAAVYGSEKMLNLYRWTFCDYIYDRCFEATKDVAARAKVEDLSNVKGAIYLTINIDNKVTDMRQG